MNTLNVLHRRTAGGTHAAPLSSPETSTTARLPVAPGRAPSSWPPGVKVLVALLAVAAMLSTVLAVIGFSRGGDETLANQLRDRIDAVTAERDQALVDVDAVTAERDAALVEVERLDAQLASLGQQLQIAEAQNDTDTARIEELVAQIAAVTDEKTAALDAVAALTAERDEALADVELLTADLASTDAQLAAVKAERDKLAKAFPVKFDATLNLTAAPGRYKVTTSQIFGTTPKLADFTIAKTPEGYLRLSVPGFVEGGLFAADGNLHMVSTSTTAVPACNGAARAATVIVTIFPGSYEVKADGAHLKNLNAMITVESPASGSCAAVLAFSAAELTKTA